MIVGYFGDTFSHTYAAAVALTEGICACELRGFDTVYDALAAVQSGTCDKAVVPLENSFEGTVVASVDALSELHLYIAAEIVLPIRQNLIVQSGVKREDIARVYSHPQALAQCRGSLRDFLPGVPAESVAYTSAALDRLDEHSAAIARSPKNGQVVLKEHLEDSPLNCTRFAAVQASPQKAGDKVSVLFSTQNKPGALLGVLNVLNGKGLNMTKIESRPAKKRMGQYVFYADFLFDGSDRQLQELFVLLSDAAEELQYLGRYRQFAQSV